MRKWEEMGRKWCQERMALGAFGLYVPRSDERQPRWA